MGALKQIKLNLETLEYYKDCFDRNGSPKNIEKIKWQFLRSSKIIPLVEMVYDEGESRIAAIYAVSAVPFKVGSENINGSQSLDTMTDVNYRGQGLFIKLAKEVYSKAKDAEVALVYGFPNGNSIYGFQKKLDWNVLDPVPFLIKPLRTGYFTKRVSWLKFLPNWNLPLLRVLKDKNYKTSSNNFFPSTCDGLWEVFSKDIQVAVQRNKSYLDWRYIDKPFENYNIVHSYDIQNRHIGFVVYAVKEKHGGRMAYIMELIFDPKHPKAAKALLNNAVKNIKKENADCILSWCMDHSPNYKAFKQNLFFKMPEKLRPIELHFGVKSLNEKYRSLISDRKNWYLSYSDSDTV
mgnify:CR=1 FL=1